jgi:hypothetical protein
MEGLECIANRTFRDGGEQFIKSLPVKLEGIDSFSGVEIAARLQDTVSEVFQDVGAIAFIAPELSRVILKDKGLVPKNRRCDQSNVDFIGKITVALEV